MGINRVVFDTRKLWRSNYPVSGDKIIKPLAGLEIEIEDGKTVEVRITNGLRLIEEILDNACWNKEDVDKQVEQVSADIKHMWWDSNSIWRQEYAKQIREKLTVLYNSIS